MQPFPQHWTINDKVDFLQKKILLNSVAERQLGINFLDDQFRDGIINQLVDLQVEYKDIINTTYSYAFKDFDASVYDDLYSRLNENDKEQIDKICRLHDIDADYKMEVYYILEEYINREDELYGDN